MSSRARPLLARSSLVALVTLVGAQLGCSGEDKSNLEKMAESDQQAGASAGASEAGASTGPSAGTKGEPKSGGESSASGGAGEPALGAGEGWPVDAKGVPIPPTTGSARLISAGAQEDRVQLRLQLDEGATYRTTTIGMLKLPLVERATGFAREEQLSLSDCRGEGAARDCLLTHRYRNYEAEPPAGKGLELDERIVSELVTAHRLDSSGLRASDTSVQGDTSPAVTEQLAAVHRFYCLRLPSEPVGLGATWRDACRTRLGGQLVTRDLTWRLAKLDRSDESSARAELEYAGRVRRVDESGKLINGEVKGVVYFWVDAGQPHLLRERVGFVLNPVNGLGTTTDLRVQFTLLDEDGETLLRTDGKPFEQSPNALNDPRSAPSGATRDGELRPKDKPEPKPN